MVVLRTANPFFLVFLRRRLGMPSVLLALAHESLSNPASRYTGAVRALERLSRIRRPGAPGSTGNKLWLLSYAAASLPTQHKS